MNKEQKALYAVLTPLQKAMAQGKLKGWTNEKSYLSACKKTKREPAKQPRSAASGILANPNVKAYIDSVKEVIVENDVDNSILDRTEAMQILTRHARGETLVETKTVEVITEKQGADGEMTEEKDEQTIFHMPDTKDMTPEQKATIAEIKVSKKDGTTIKQHSPREAIKLMAELEGWKKDEGKGNGEIHIHLTAADMAL